MIFAAAFYHRVFALLGLTVPALLGLAATLFICYFFRDPDRVIPRRGKVWVSPADGKVVFAKEIDDLRFYQGRCIKVSIFMSVFNVHVNRIPYDGTVGGIDYYPGKFLSAHLDKASVHNEHNAIFIETDDHRKIWVVQIAGLIARRIICRLQVGDTVVRGRRFGMICFGSRLDVYLPSDSELKVSLGGPRPGRHIDSGGAFMMKTKRIQTGKTAARDLYSSEYIYIAESVCGFYAVIAAIERSSSRRRFRLSLPAFSTTWTARSRARPITTSKFGVEYDSLADLVSFGLAPGVVMYLWALTPLGADRMAGGLFVHGVRRASPGAFQYPGRCVSSDHFVGLPIPAAAGMAAATVLIFNKFGIDGSSYPVFILVTLTLLSFLMVSTISYDSFKRPELFKKMKFDILVISILILIFIAAQPSIALYVFGFVYVVSGPSTVYGATAIKTGKSRGAQRPQTGVLVDISV